MSRWFAFVAVLGLLVGCATGGAELRVECNVPGASLWIDDVLVGPVSEWKASERRIRAGFRRVEVRHPGYYSHYAELDLREGGESTVKAELAPQLD